MRNALEHIISIIDNKSNKNKSQITGQSSGNKELSWEYDLVYLKNWTGHFYKTRSLIFQYMNISGCRMKKSSGPIFSLIRDLRLKS